MRPLQGNATSFLRTDVLIGREVKGKSPIPKRLFLLWSRNWSHTPSLTLLVAITTSWHWVHPAWSFLGEMMSSLNLADEGPRDTPRNKRDFYLAFVLSVFQSAESRKLVVVVITALPLTNKPGCGVGAWTLLDKPAWISRWNATSLLHNW